AQVSDERQRRRAARARPAGAAAALDAQLRRALQAAAAAATAAGTAVITHPSNAVVAFDQARTLVAGGVEPARIQIGHCDSYAVADLLPVLSTGVFVAFDQCVYTAKI